MATIGKVRAVFTANAAGLTSGVNAAAASMRKMESSVSSLRSGMNALVAIQGAQFFAGIVSSAGGYVRSLISMGQAQADVIDSTSKLAARTGMAYGEFAGLALAGDLAGVGMDTIAKAATKADIAFVKAQGGSKVAQAAFAGLGLSMEQLAGMGAADRFEAIAASIAALPTEAQRAAAATQLFGKAGQDLLPLFAGGAEGIAQAREQAERLGLALTTAQGQDVEAMNDSFTLVGKAVEGIVQQVTAYLAPAVTAVAETFTNLVGSVGGANIGQAIGDGILQGARFLAGIGDWLISNLSGVWEYVSQIGGQWNSVVEFLNRAGAFLAGVFDSAQAGLGMIILGFGGVVEFLLTTAQQIGQFLGFDTSTLDSLVAGAQAFNAEVSNGITENVNGAAANFERALGSGEGGAAGQAIAGPLTTALDAAISQAEASASAVDAAGQGAADSITAAAEAAAEPQALQGVDSRSAEGVSEMFRLMRGGDGVQERQLAALETIAENTAGGDDSYPFAFE